MVVLVQASTTSINWNASAFYMKKLACYVCLWSALQIVTAKIWRIDLGMFDLLEKKNSIPWDIQKIYQRLEKAIFLCFCSPNPKVSLAFFRVFLEMHIRVKFKIIVCIYFSLNNFNDLKINYKIFDININGSCQHHTEF